MRTASAAVSFSFSCGPGSGRAPHGRVLGVQRRGDVERGAAGVDPRVAEECSAENVPDLRVMGEGGVATATATAAAAATATAAFDSSAAAGVVNIDRLGGAGDGTATAL